LSPPGVRHVLAVALLVAVGGAALPAAPAEARVVRSLSADLDLERVETVRTRVRRSYFLYWIEVRDGTRATRISPRVERIGVQVADLNRDGRPDVFYQGSMGASGRATEFGVSDWTGAGERELWSYSWRRTDLGQRFAGASARLIEDPGAGAPGAEIELVEGVRRRGEPSCCPSRQRVSRFRWDGTRFTRYAQILRPTR
jgi:hypothetical protein